MKYFIIALLLTSMVAAFDFKAVASHLKDAVVAKAGEVAKCAGPALLKAGKQEALDALKSNLPAALAGLVGGRRLWWNPISAVKKAAGAVAGAASSAAGALKNAACAAGKGLAVSGCGKAGRAALGKVKGLLVQKCGKYGKYVETAWSAIGPCLETQIDAGCSAAVNKVCGRRRRLIDLKAVAMHMKDAIVAKAAEVAKCAGPALLKAGKAEALTAFKSALPAALAGLVGGRRLWWNPVSAVKKAAGAVAGAASSVAGKLKDAACAAGKGLAVSGCGKAGRAALGKVKGLCVSKAGKYGKYIETAWSAIGPCIETQIDAGCSAAVNKVCARRF